MLALSGELLYLVTEGPALDEALRGATAIGAKLQGGEAFSKEEKVGLAIVGGVALNESGRERVWETEGLVGVLLSLAESTEDYSSVKTALRALERLTEDEAYGSELLQLGAMVS